MKKFVKRMRMPSPALIVAMIALIVAVGGTASAALSGKDKKKVKKIAAAEIAKLAPGLTVGNATNATNAANATNANNANSLGGIAASGYHEGAGNTYFGTRSAGVSTNNNVVLAIPGIATIQFDCDGAGVNPVPEIVNTSGVALLDVGQSQENADGAYLEPFGPSIAPAATLALAARPVSHTSMMLWTADNSKNASIEFAHVFCSFTARATTNGG